MSAAKLLPARLSRLLLSPRTAVLDWVIGVAITLTWIVIFDPILPAAQANGSASTTSYELVGNGHSRGCSCCGTAPSGPPVRGTPINDPGPLVSSVQPSAQQAASATLPPPASHHGAGQAGGNAALLESLKLEGDGPHELAWEVLSCFEFTKQKEGGAEGKGEIPAQIKAIAGKKITVTGFSLPIRMRGTTGEIAEVLLMRNPLQCCYGVAPRANEWIHVNLSDNVKVDASTGRMTATGILEVGEVYRDGWLASIYRLNNAQADAVK